MADLEKAIEEVEALVTTYADNTQYDAFRLILSANREMREALLNIDACSQHSYGFSDFSMRRRCGQIARSALTTQRRDGE